MLYTVAVTIILHSLYVTGLGCKDNESRFAFGRLLLSAQCPAIRKVAGCCYDYVEEDCRAIPVTKIAEGDIIPGSKYPFMVSLLVERQQGRCLEHKCGASLILPNVLLTAAHCLKAVPYSVEFTNNDGVYEINERLVAIRGSSCRHQAGEDQSEVIKAIVHPGYNNTNDSEANDIAILILDRDLSLQSSHFINVLNATYAENWLRQDQQRKLIQIGFGQTGAGDADYRSTALRESTTANISVSSCADELAAFSDETPAHWEAYLNESVMLCTSGRVSRTCLGDSGGPVFIKIESGQYIQVGITSWGLKEPCRSDRMRAPGVLTRVSVYVDWIVDVVSQYSGRRNAASQLRTITLEDLSQPGPEPNGTMDVHIDIPDTNVTEAEALLVLKDRSGNALSFWDWQENSDPCRNRWEFITCKNGKVPRQRYNSTQFPSQEVVFLLSYLCCKTQSGWMLPSSSLLVLYRLNILYGLV
eukprot:TRINITY_DN12123_c1_g1_i1.p1 TRINITY_DN12123_c1_g1~~TRINITY_DN12123_c1_g1_i1.p1  ORF type:complete len:510 (+),score=25.85 TRINITY_DN12123_c1_g1_i1:115-1530(+)